MKKRIFVIGVGRSGTSLLQAMLAAHPDLSSLPETGFLRRYMGGKKLEKVSKRLGTEAVTRELEADPYFARLGLSAGALVAAAQKSDLPMDSALYREIARHFTSGGNGLVDKDPRLAEFLPLIKMHFPFAYVLHIIRDPRDVIVSKRQAQWSKHQPLWRQLVAGAAQMELAERYGPALFAQRYISLTYERLIEQPEETLEEICLRLGISYDEQMLAFAQSSSALVAASEMDWKGKTLGPLLPRNSGKWQGSLSDQDAALTQASCGRAMRLGEYARAPGRAGIQALAVRAAARGYSLWRGWHLNRSNLGSHSLAGRVVWHDNSTLYRASGHRILGSSDHGRRWKIAAQLPVSLGRRLSSRSDIVNRLLRGGLHHFAVSPVGSMIIWGGKAFLQSDNRVMELGPIVGSRPLKLTCAHGSFFYGEYRQNPERSPVNIWRWSPANGGSEWTSAWQFDDVRHVHGVYHDPFSDALWVTTGDDDGESAIWRTDDNFRTLQKVVGGEQRYRAVDLVFSERYVYFGTDAPGDKNFICRMHRQGHSVEQMQEVAGPVMYGARVGDALFFSTSVEPAPGHHTRDVQLWGSDDGEGWTLVSTFRKDLWPKRAFQYGQAHFPSGPGDGRRLYVTPFAAGRHGQTQVYLFD